MRTYMLMLCAALMIAGCAGQEQQKEFDCKSFLEQKIEVGSTPGEMLKPFDDFRHCGLDSADMGYFVNGPVIGPVIIEIGKDTITYGDVLNKILPLVKDLEYIKMKQANAQLRSMKHEVVTDENWPAIRPLLKDAFGYSDQDLDHMDQVRLQNADKHYTLAMLKTAYEQERERWPLE